MKSNAKSVALIILFVAISTTLFLSGLIINPRAAAAQEQPKITEGTLQVIDKEGKAAGKCPLKHTEVEARVSGNIARVDVTQEFHNPYDEKIEAVYVFPLSQKAAVDNMVMTVGKRKIRGEIKRREEARRIYEDAKQKGHVASLLDQERPNIFTQSVANIMPGENVTIKISYVEYLKYEDARYEFVFPMVVGPRYIPGEPTGKEGTGWAPDTGQVPDASKITPPVTPEGTRAGHDISIKVQIDAGVNIKDIQSKLHEIKTRWVGRKSAEITLERKKTIPNKDFILTYKTADEQIESALLTHAPKGMKGFFTLIVQPPEKVPVKKITPKEMIFVIDSSGSMSGWPIEKAKETMKLCIKKMNPDDTFQLVTFSNDIVKLFDKPQPNTELNREAALRFLGERVGRGGTEMLKPILEVLALPPDPERIRIICFMTDGYVGNDMQITDAVQKNIGSTRFFSFGVGNSVNRFLLDEMARFGRGEVEYVTLDEPGAQAAERFHERIANPLLTDIQIDWGGLPVSDVYPITIPDLFSSKPLVITGRYNKTGAAGKIRITGKVAGKHYEKSLSVTLPKCRPEHDVLAPLWARTRIDYLTSQNYLGIQRGKPNEEIKEAITKLGLNFRLVTQFTSFVAVEEMVITEGGKPKTVAVPVEMPEGVSYEGVFGKEKMAYASVAANAPIKHTGKPMVAEEMEIAPSVDTIAVEPSPEEKKERLLKSRLAPELQGLAEKVEKEGKKGNLKLEGFEVKNWKLKVAVWLQDTSERNLETLKKSGFKVLAESKAANLIVGEIDVRKLEELALLDFVSFVRPQTE
ncbi:MAG: VIT and VWA domain-containing protein [bacterium]